MIVHSVFFWLKENLSPEDRATFDAGARSLLAQDNVSGGSIGTPAATPERPVIDNSYTVALHVNLDDMAAHDAYQEDPNHLSFIETCAPFWDNVVIYDADVS